MPAPLYGAEFGCDQIDASAVLLVEEGAGQALLYKQQWFGRASASADEGSTTRLS
jgi:hypothetical protein